MSDLSQTANAPLAASESFLGHPRGLATLFMTEFFERFAYYGMRAILVLFLIAATDGSNPGFGIDRETAGAVYGLYTAAVYLGCLPGGWIADRLIGQRNAVFWGALTIMAGNLILTIPANPAVFYLGLAVNVIGVGLLKPNISAIVGALYDGQPGARRDAGFSIFYVGINLGALVAPLVAGTLGEVYNWRLGFLSAGLAMAIGALQYKLTERYLGELGRTPPVQNDAERRRTWIAVTIALFALLLFAALVFTGIVPVTVPMLAQAFGVIMIALAFSFFGYILVLARITREERKRVVVIAALFLGAAIFWAGYEQQATTFNIFALDFTDRTLLGQLFPDGLHPASWYQSASPIFIVLFAPFVAWIWVVLGVRNLDPSAPAKFGLGLLLLGVGFLIMMFAAQRVVSTGSDVAPTWLLLGYAMHTFGELCLSPVGLSNVTKLAPARYVSQMMGTWFLGSAVGNLLAGLIGGRIAAADSSSLPDSFLQMSLIGLGAGTLMLMLARPLRKWTGSVN